MKKLFVPGDRFVLNEVEHLVTGVTPYGGVAIKTRAADGSEHFFCVKADLGGATPAVPRPIQSKLGVIARSREFNFEARYSGKHRRWFFAPINNLFVMSLDRLEANLRASGVRV